MSSSPKKPSGKDDSEKIDPPAPPKVTRYVQPLGPRVLVRIIKSPDRLDSGLFLPDGAKEEGDQALLGEVLEVARSMPTEITYPLERDEEHEGYGGEQFSLGQNVSGIPVSSQVLFRKDHGVSVPWDDTLRIIDVRRILAIVDEILVDDLQ